MTTAPEFYAFELGAQVGFDRRKLPECFAVCPFRDWPAMLEYVAGYEWARERAELAWSRSYASQYGRVRK